MKITSFFDLRLVDFNASAVVSLRQSWNTGMYFSYLNVPRPDHGLCYIARGQIGYVNAAGDRLTAHRGEVVYLPKDGHYRAEFDDQGWDSGSDYLVNFLLRDAEGREIEAVGAPAEIVGRDENGSLCGGFERLPRLYCDGADRAKIKQELYGLFYGLLANKAAREPLADCLAYIGTHITEPFTVAKLAARFGMCETEFRRQFRRCTGESPVQYINRHKIDRACALLASSDVTVTSVADMLGFYDTAYFSKVFLHYKGVTPGRYGGRRR